MVNTITINASMLKAAMVVTKRENVRYVLTGVSLKTNGVMNTTNGMVAFHGKNAIIAGKLEKDIIIPTFKITKDVYAVVLNIDGDKVRVDLLGKGMTSINIVAIDGNYPDVTGFCYDETCCEIVNSKSISVNPAFLKMALEIFPKSAALRIENFTKESDAVMYLVTSQGDFLTDKQLKMVDPKEKSFDPDFDRYTEKWQFIIMPILDTKYKNEKE